jgi:nitrogen fixation NifU-like protein
MDIDEETRAGGQPVAFYGEMDLAELAQEVARRASERFSAKTLRAALFPKHMGTMNQPDGYANARGECGDLMTFYLHIDQGRILEITFTTDGCDATIASGEMLATIVTGISLEEAARVTPDDLLTALDGLPSNHIHCAGLAVQTLHRAVESYPWEQTDGA